MGGHDAGEIASQIAIEAIAEALQTADNEPDFRQILEMANSKVYDAMYSEVGRPAMGTTIVGVVLCGNKVAVFNVGDSRAYTLEGFTLSQCSFDDRLGARRNNTQNTSHVLTQSLGGTIRRHPLNTYFRKVNLSEETRLLLCSDGLTDMLDENEIADILIRNSDRPTDVLLHAALDAGATDNVSIIVIGCADDV